MEMAHLGKDEMKKLQKEMGPFYALQFLLTVMTTVAFASLLPYLKAFSAYHVALWIWIGFIAPIQIASVVWGSTKRKFWCKQLFVMLSFQLTSILLTAWIVTM